MTMAGDVVGIYATIVLAGLRMSASTAHAHDAGVELRGLLRRPQASAWARVPALAGRMPS